MLRHHRGNLISAGLLLLLAGIMFAATFGFPPPGQADDPGTAAFPRILAAGLGILAGLLFFGSGQTQALPRGPAALRVAGVLGLLLVYALTLEVLGFMAATVLFLIATLLVAGARNPLVLGLLPAGLSIALFYVFNQLLSVSLPRAFLEGVLF